jgi:Xaa-Pro aminopeptidase
VPTGGRLALDAESVTWSDQRGYAGAFEGCELVPTEGLVGGLRVVKDAGEVARMRAAAAIADEALAAVLPRLSAGDTEARVALAFDTTIRELGADGPAFDTIVASGGNGARPHHEPGERAIRRGDLVIIDCGATVDGYRSDMTRTFSIGEPDESAAAMVELVTRAQAAGLAAVAPGRAAVTIDEACRAVIAEAGRGEEFLHGAGHGVGLDIHESPWAVPGSEDDLDEGMVVTVEPGVYRSGLGGVRIEDTVLVTPAGAEPLTWHPKEPFVLPAPA